jgi:hypothetical protein
VTYCSRLDRICYELIVSIVRAGMQFVRTA